MKQSSQVEHPMHILNYQIVQSLYKSSNTLVYRAIKTKHNPFVMLRILKKDYPTSEELACYRQEYDIMCRLAHLEWRSACHKGNKLM